MAAFVAPFAQNIEAIDAGKGEVEDCGVVGGAVQGVLALQPGGKPVNAKAHFAQPDLDAVADQLVIFHQ